MYLGGALSWKPTPGTHLFSYFKAYRKMGCVPAVVRLPSAKREFRRDAVSTLNSDKILDVGEEFDYVRACFLAKHG